MDIYEVQMGQLRIEVVQSFVAECKATLADPKASKEAKDRAYTSLMYLAGSAMGGARPR